MTGLTDPTAAREPAILLFDGVCNLCRASVRFVLARDPAGRFRFASLQSERARRLLAPHRLPAEALSSVVLLENGRAYTRSTAVLRVARRLRPPWPLLYATVVVPRPLRDALYDFVARHRLRWFGRRDVCSLPAPGARERFLDADEWTG